MGGLWRFCSRSRRVGAALALAASVLLGLVSCREQGVPRPEPKAPVIIISIDTLRSDRLPVYGYSGVETPNIDAFRNDAVLYRKAYSHTPLTLPSHASILTGLLPADHGVRDNTGYQLGEGVRTLGEVLAESGYATGAAISSFVMRRETKIDRGFEFYDDTVAPLSVGHRQISTIQRDGSSTTAVATEWIAKQTRPVFFLLHLYEPHTPYTPPEPYRSRYAHPYDGEIARVDEIVGDFLNKLKASGLYEKALIILLSDHGEGLNDHGEDEHGFFLYREAIQVPLMVKLPGRRLAGKVVETPVQLVDVFPTVLERTGLPIPAGLPGHSLVAFATQEPAEARRIYSESYYAKFHFGWADQHSLIDGRHHYIESTRPELFDLSSDFAEKNNILESDRRTFFAMKKAIEPLIREAEAPAPADAEEIAKLAALGYLGSTVQTNPGETLPDPKDRIGDVKRVNAAFIAFHQKQYEEALATIDTLLAENPRLLDLWDLKSKTLARLGRLPAAVEASKQGLRLSPTAHHLAIDVATLQLELGNLDDAEQHAELAMKAAPAQAHELLARVWIARKDLANAEIEARKSIEKERERVAPLITLARVYREQGKLDEALELLNEAVRRRKQGQEVAMLFHLRGDVLARLGRVEEAEADFRKEIENFPDDPASYKNLVLLLVAQGRSREGADLIRKLIAEAPVPNSYHAVCDVLSAVGDDRGVRYWARQGLVRYPDDPVLKRLAS